MMNAHLMLPDVRQIRLFVGYDSEQALASSVFAHTANRLASVPISISFLVLQQLKGFFDRPRDPLQSTEFAFSRFLVPFLSRYEGWSIFVDGDMILRADIAELMALADERYAVQVVQRQAHEISASGRKFLGRQQVAYPRKNWSSVMLFNNAKCWHLTPEVVRDAPGLWLHTFGWLRDDDIGPLPPEWNHLVGVDQPNPEAKLVHYTLGMPMFNGWKECEFAPEWRAERDLLFSHESRAEEAA